MGGGLLQVRAVVDMCRLVLGKKIAPDSHIVRSNILV